MDRVIVTVKRTAEYDEHDLELPAHVPAAELIPAIITALGWGQGPGGPLRYQVMVQPQESLLKPHETLAEVNAWDGARLFFAPQNGPSDDTPTYHAAPQAALDRQVPSSETTQSENKYRWKKIDQA